MYGSRASVDIRRQEAGGTIAVLRVPFLEIVERRQERSGAS
jgi:hypothetical protein